MSFFKTRGAKFPYDRLSKKYSCPQGQLNDKTAKRWFEHIVKNSEMIANDLCLYYVGCFDEDKGVVAADEKVLIKSFNEEVNVDEKKTSSKK